MEAVFLRWFRLPIPSKYLPGYRYMLFLIFDITLGNSDGKKSAFAHCTFTADFPSQLFADKVKYQVHPKSGTAGTAFGSEKRIKNFFLLGLCHAFTVVFIAKNN
jgi:hypothetical protein